MEESNRNKNQLERITYQIQDELRMVKSRLDAEVSDLSQVAKELRGRSKKLEDEYRQTVSRIDLKKNRIKSPQHLRKILHGRKLSLHVRYGRN